MEWNLMSLSGTLFQKLTEKSSPEMPENSNEDRKSVLEFSVII